MQDLNALRIVHADPDAFHPAEPEARDLLDVHLPLERALEDAIHLRRDEPLRRRQVEVQDRSARCGGDERDGDAHDGANHT